MSLVVYSFKKIKGLPFQTIDLSGLNFIPDQIIFVDQNNVNELDSRITKLPAVIKKVADQESVIEGQEVFEIEEFTRDEKVKHMAYNRRILK